MTALIGLKIISGSVSGVTSYFRVSMIPKLLLMYSELNLCA